ncbi:glucokinase [Candidatus Woesearchaeota archaeon]|nr:glucokinase [Candidatus Woesearchaeota archaeon]MCF8013021.1 glucokinase [Candidatus Woesearchaeota archaeon]
MNNIILEKHSNHKFSENILCLDIGGTITQIGIIGIKNKEPYLAYSTDIWTNEIKNIYSFTEQIITFVKKELQITIKKTAIAIAGPINKDKTKAHQTNNNIKINIKELKKKQKQEKTILLNDFEALGYSINLIHKQKNQKPIALIGTGTGLGKTLLIHNGKYYEPMPSEGCFADFPITNKEEIELAKQITKGKRNLQQEDILSGRGIAHIYDFLRSQKKIKESEFTKKIDESKDKIYEIVKHKRHDKTCIETYKEFSKYLARIVKNYALETLPYDGIYLGGGIITRNPETIGKEFFKELNNLDKNQKEIIKGIPINVLPQKEASLLGLAFAMIHTNL